MLKFCLILMFSLVLFSTVDSVTYSCNDPCALSKALFSSNCALCTPYNCTSTNGVLSFCTYCGPSNIYRLCGTYNISNRSVYLNYFYLLLIGPISLVLNFKMII